MNWSMTNDPATFLAEAGTFLRTEPARNTTLLTVASTMLAVGATAFGTATDQAPVLGWWRSAAHVRGAFLQTPPHPPVLTRLPPGAATALATALADSGRTVSGVDAGQEEAVEFATQWSRLTGAASRGTERHRLYRLAALTPPQPAPEGHARLASAEDRATLISWYHAFDLDVGHDPTRNTALVDDRIDHGGLMLWEVDGTPVAFAGRTRIVEGMSRVAPVYTPHQLRRRGYGGAVTTAISQAALDGGATEVVLYTDLANPTSNALYQRLGYRPVEDRLLVSFTR